MPRVRLTLWRLLILVAAAAVMLAVVATAYRAWRGRRLDSAAWLDAKAAEFRAFAAEQERSGSLAVAKQLREEADRCEERARIQLPPW